MLREQAELKLREEQILAKQQETIDRSIIAQQRLEAIPVQNYEYPIPRLFVILPDLYEKRDPRKFMTERFRLFFLCECGDHCRNNCLLWSAHYWCRCFHILYHHQEQRPPGQP